MGSGPLPVDLLTQPERDRVKVAAPEPPPVLRSEEAGSSFVAMLTPSASPVRRPPVLNDSPEVDAWLKLMERRGAIDELVTFFYDSLSSMMGRAEEFFGLH